MEENGGDFDLVEIWKNSSETGQKQFKKFSSTFLSSLGRDSSNRTPFDAVGLILSPTHLLPSQNLMKIFKIFEKKNYIFIIKFGYGNGWVEDKINPTASNGVPLEPSRPKELKNDNEKILDHVTIRAWPIHLKPILTEFETFNLTNTDTDSVK